MFISGGLGKRQLAGGVGSWALAALLFTVGFAVLLPTGAGGSAVLGPRDGPGLLSPTVGGTPIVSLTATPSSFVVGSSTQIGAQVSQGTPPYAYTWNGLPPGCSGGNISSLSCTPSQAGNYPVSVGVRDSLGNSSSSNTVSLIVYSPVSVSLMIAPNSVGVNQNVSVSASVTGGTGVYTYSYAGLPPSCPSSNRSSFQCSTGSPGSYSVSATVRDSAGNSATSNSASFQVTSNTGGGGNNGGNGSGGQNKNNGSGFNGSGFSNLFSSLGPMFALALLMGIVAFFLLAILAASALAIAILLARRLPPRAKRGALSGGVACPSCGASAPAGSKFCPACGKSIVPPGAQ